MIRTNLSTMYQEANPKRDAKIDRLELRADSDAAELRVKGQAAFWGFTPGRSAHQRHALFQAKTALGNSLRERLSNGSPEQVKGYLDHIWRDVIGQGTELRVQQVLQLRNAVNAITVIDGRAVVAAAVQRHKPPVASSHASAAAPSRTPVERIAENPDRKAPPTPQALLAKHSAGPAESTAVQDTRARLARENDRNEALSHLKKTIAASPFARLTRAEQAIFNDRLRNLVECADRYLPELMRGRAQDHAILEAAAGHVHRSEGLRLDSRAALYKALVACDVGAAQRLFRALPPGEASVLSKSLAIEHSQPRTLADTAKEGQQSGQNSLLQK